jgi:oligopeptide/dipeptide ABC transporter ATP-binding protein
MESPFTDISPRGPEGLFKPAELEALIGVLESVRRDPPLGCHFNTRCPVAMERCFTEEPEYREAKPAHMVACHLVE